MAKPSRKQSKPNLPLHKKLLLNQYMLSLFGVRTFADISRRINDVENENLTEDRISKFCYALQALPLSQSLAPDMLLAYDQNIVAHSLDIQKRRPSFIRWKYFQYLALIFTEIYLDRFLNDRAAFTKELNDFAAHFNRHLPDGDKIDAFDENDLRKIAFWSATGSGKTLIMHVNIKQYLHYLKKYRTDKMNRILLVTPNEGLSQQHLAEFKLSGINARLFSKQAADLLTDQEVEILEITKLSETAGDKTVALEAFENNNLVLVDEGHRGASGDVWAKNRKKLAEKGFAFEYSATFGQAVSGDQSLTQEYAKSILFDYSYRYFYNDGYGKDYRILNLPEMGDDYVRELYLTACLLTFYQQKLLFKEPQSTAKKFNIENPLLVFVGGSVTKSTKARDISDTVDIVQFLARLTSPANKQAVINRIARAISGDTGLLDEQAHDIFANIYPYLSQYQQKPELIYDAIIHDIFNATSPASLHIEELKGSSGEIALNLGGNEPFGVINVGDAAKLCSLLASCDDVHVSEKHFNRSLFHNINHPDSMINILIGSRKFSEGWNSWRVSTMGLMNVGRKEGSQIIQLFGRGVRLKGYENSLKRHSSLQDGSQTNPRLACLENLNIFGIRADYMEQFKKYLEAEDIPTARSYHEIVIPVHQNLIKKGLKTISLKGKLNYQRNGNKPSLSLCDFMTRNKITLDYYPRIQTQMAATLFTNQESTVKYCGHLKPEHLDFLDMDALYFDLQNFKHERSWFNLNIPKAEIRKILANPSWYELLIPQDQLSFNHFGKVALWQNIALILLQKYCDRFYKLSKDAWEANHREYQELDNQNPNFIPYYTILVDQSQPHIIEQLKQISQSLPQNDLFFGQNRALIFDRHLYQPLLCSERSDIKIKPAALNKGEGQFVEDLRNFYYKNTDFFANKELYLLRNMSRGRGLGFFEAGNFYPDFIMWIVEGIKQYICFIDPKGLHHLGPKDPKLVFYKTIKKVEEQLGDPNIVLDAFILSVTPYHKLAEQWNNQDMSEVDWEAKHILFQETPGHMNRLFNKIERQN